MGRKSRQKAERRAGHHTGGPPPPPDEPLDLMRDVRRALADPVPLPLLEMVSSILEVFDPRQPDRQEGVRREELIQSFMHADMPETTALLTVIAGTTADELERARIQRELHARHDRLPDWLHMIGQARAYRAVEQVHVLGDGDNVVVGVRFPTGEEFTAVTYIDHNVGTLVKDAFFVPDAIGPVLSTMRQHAEDDDISWNDIPLADARTRIAEAIDAAARVMPPFESETWPAGRPLLEWVTRLLPAGGQGYRRPDWNRAQRDDLIDRFVQSPFGSGLDGEDVTWLADDFVTFACDHGTGDPLRWSPVTVEILLVDWIPRHVIADLEYLARAPRVLKAWIRFAHQQLNVNAGLTDETLQAVDRWVPDYKRLISSPRRELAVERFRTELVDDDEFDYPEFVLDELRRRVGGEEALSSLSDRWLPDEPFEWSGISEEIRPAVEGILGLVDSCCDAVMTIEHRTAARRLLARTAVADPAVLIRRNSPPVNTAAALCYAVYYLNNAQHEGIMVKHITGHLGSKSSPGSRAFSLINAVHANESLDFLVSAERRRIQQQRDFWEAELDTD